MDPALATCGSARRKRCQRNEDHKNNKNALDYFIHYSSNIKVTGNAEPKDIDLPETSVAFSCAATG